MFSANILLVPSTVLSTLYVLTNRIVTIILGGGNDYPHFTNGKTSE